MDTAATVPRLVFGNGRVLDCQRSHIGDATTVEECGVIGESRVGDGQPDFGIYADCSAVVCFVVGKRTASDNNASRPRS